MATYTFTPNRQSTKKPLTLATLFNFELIAGAQAAFGFGTLQVVPLPLPLLGDEAAC